MSDETVTLPRNSLLIFLDETGDELYSDPKHPVFGVGGCAVTSEDYLGQLRPEWIHLKQNVLGIVNRPFHAVDFEHSRPGPAMIEAINAFMRFSFYRIAVLTDLNTKRPDDMDGHQVVAAQLFEYIRKLIEIHPATSCLVFFEHSQRKNDLLERDLPLYSMEARNSSGQPIEVSGYTLPKSSCEPGIEIADLISHTCGKQQRNHFRNFGGGTPLFTPDFSAVFHTVPRELIYFHSITEIAAKDGENLEVAYWPHG